jgi:hypothetical protein
MEINIELWVNISGSLTPNPAIVDNLCPDQCNDNGSCIEGMFKLPVNKLINIHVN